MGMGHQNSNTNKILRVKYIIAIIIIILVTTTVVYINNKEKSVNLVNENLNGIELYKEYSYSELKKEYELYRKQNNSNYKECLEFDDIIICTNQQSQVVFIAPKNSKLETNKGLKIGSHIDKVIKKYGDNYYTDIEQGEKIIGYRDRKNNISLEFWHYQDIVNNIRLYDSRIEN
jgi:hypothetical protein